MASPAPASAERPEPSGPSPARTLLKTTVCVVLGGAGFLGSHVAAALVRSGCTVVVADRRPCPYMAEHEICTRFVPADLRNRDACDLVFDVAASLAGPHPDHDDAPTLWVFHFAADMGGMGYLAPNEGAAMLANAAMTANVVRAVCTDSGRVPRVSRLVLASSACVYPESLQGTTTTTAALREEDAWPADPQDGYGLEKLFGEELAKRAAGAGVDVRVARFHNVYGPRGTWIGGREKAPAAFLRKALCLRALDRVRPGHGVGLEVWGDGSQARTFCYIADAVDGVLALTRSDTATAATVNIGSDEVVSVTELARLAGEQAGLERAALEARLVYERAGPIGVQGRSADISRAARELGWRPQVALADGLRSAKDWIAAELDAILKAAGGEDGQAAFLRSALTSHRSPQAPVRRIGLLVPVTSRIQGRDVNGAHARVASGVSALLASVAATTQALRAAWQFDVCFGVDAGDPVCDPAHEDAVDLVGLVRERMPLAWALGSVTARVRTFTYPPGLVCHIWADLAADAFAAGADLTVLLGDDVELLSPGWPDALWDAFEAIARDTGHPFGFGCVAFADDAFPGFPTFPVIHSTHAHIFGGRIFPSSFRNQDADPFLFQIYRAFQAARLEPAARLVNKIGGADDARYRKVHVPWTDATLTGARDAAAQWLRLHAQQRAVTLDVVVPTYRVERTLLEAILALPVPADVSTQFTIVCDHPGDPAAAAVMADLAATHRHNPMVRLRTNDRNVGAGPTRNRGLAESAADWVLFLDDDVVPDAGILAAYARAIRAHPNATGFIGLSTLPPPTTTRQAGVFMAGVAFFWTIARTEPKQTELPWGVTANLCVRRPPAGTVAFADVFPRTGGGEDIDFCLRLREYVRATVPGSEGFVAVPDARIHHPWWDGGVPRYSHFAGWAYGDGHLIDLFPALTYRNLPDLGETLLALGAVAVGSGISAAAGAVGRRGVRLAPVAAVACVLADLAFDLWRQVWQGASAECAHLPWHVRAAGVAQALVIRTASEMGRMAGHTSRHRLLHNVGRRFNWFGYMWAGMPAAERREALWRTTVRVTAVLLASRLV